MNHKLSVAKLPPDLLYPYFPTYGNPLAAKLIRNVDRPIPEYGNQGVSIAHGVANLRRVKVWRKKPKLPPYNRLMDAWFHQLAAPAYMRLNADAYIRLFSTVDTWISTCGVGQDYRMALKERYNAKNR